MQTEALGNRKIRAVQFSGVPQIRAKLLLPNEIEQKDAATDYLVIIIVIIFVFVLIIIIILMVIIIIGVINIVLTVLIFFNGSISVTIHIIITGPED